MEPNLAHTDFLQNIYTELQFSNAFSNIIKSSHCLKQLKINVYVFVCDNSYV